MLLSKNFAVLKTILLALVLPALSSADEVASEVTERVNDLPGTPVRVIAVSDTVTKIDGYGAISLINTSDGSLVIDAGFYDASSGKQKELVDELKSGPVRKLILTHAHPDHSGGITHWSAERAAGMEIVSHQRYRYMARH